MPAWAWLLSGFILVCLELFAPTGFFLFIIGLAALVTGLIEYFGLQLPAYGQWIVCAAIAVGLIVGIRPAIAGRFKLGARDFDDELVGETVVIDQDLGPNQIGKGELRGASWNIKNAGNQQLNKGERYLVEKVEGLTLLIGIKRQ